METPLLTTDKVKSLNVEESRAKRLGRQQARLRDRGGIFRPINRNNNLFDILVQATHRKSPAKGRGPSRSHSVSPQKKVKITPNKPQVIHSSKPSVSKRKAAVGMDAIAELAEDDAVVKPRKKNSKGKQKQVSETEVEREDDSTKFKPQSKKAKPQQKKNTASQCKTKSATSHECFERRLSPTKAQKTKPKGRRKKTDVDEDGAVKIPPPKKPPVKNKSVPQTSANAEREIIKYDKVATAGNDADMEMLIEIGKPSKKAKVDRPGDSPDEPVVPTKLRSRKRKVESEALDGDDVPLPKRRAPSKSREAAVRDGDLRAMNHTLTESYSMTQDLVDAINGVQPLAKKVEEHSGPTKSEKKRSALKEVSHSDHQSVGPQSHTIPKAKRKRSRAPVEVDDEPKEAETVAKKPKTATVKPKKDVLRPKATGIQKIKESSCEPGLTKESAKNNSGKRAPTTVSRKRKENAAFSKLKKPTSTSKGGLCIPLHIKKKLDAQRDTCLSDDEPDPIDFLS